MTSAKLPPPPTLPAPTIPAPTLPAPPPSVQNLTMHFSQLQTRLYTSLKISLLPLFILYFNLLVFIFMLLGSCHMFSKQLANNH